jgi:peptidyl-prolyl cis-trans isomerase SurA
MTARILPLCLFALLLALPVSAAANVVDRSVAVVNEVGKPIFQKVAEETPPEQLNEVMGQVRRTIIEKLIDKKLVVQEASKLNLKVSDEEVESALQRILSNNQATMEQFRQEIAGAGMSEKQYREDLREQILSSRLINSEVRAKIVISEERAREYYDTHYTGQAAEAGPHLLQIGIRWEAADQSDTVPDRDQARARIEQVRALALAGEDFRELAKQHSNLPTAADGGDLGTFKVEELAASIRTVVAGLQPGTISDIVEQDGSYQIFSILSTGDGGSGEQKPFAEVQEEIREKLAREEMEHRFKDWLKGIREKAYIKIL